MKSIVVDRVSRASEKREFLKLPFRLYADDPLWVAPLNTEIKKKLDPARHPFYRHGELNFFLARRNGRIVGRTAALVDRASNDFHQEKVAGFGLIEFERDPEVAQALLKEAARFGADQGMEILRGPFSFSTNEECGTLVQGFDRSPVVMMPYNPPWHAGLYEKIGISKARDLIAYFIDQSASFTRLERLARRVINRSGLTVRPLSVKKFNRELDRILEVYNSAWEKNWGFVPMDPDEFKWQAQKMKPVLKPDLVLIAKAEDRPVGFSLSLPDLNHAMKPMKGRLFPFGLVQFLLRLRSITGLRVMAMGVKPEHRNQGVEAVLIHQTIVNGLKRGYNWAELSWVLEDNRAMCHLAENIGARPYKKYRIWEAPIKGLI